MELFSFFCVLEMFILLHAIRLITVVPKKIEVFSVDCERHNLYLICVHSCPFILIWTEG